MKKLFFLLLLFPVLVLAQEVAPSTEDIWQAPAWFEKMMAFVLAMPKLGPVLEKAILWLGVISSVLTILSAAFVGIGKSLVLVLRSTKLESAANTVEKYAKLVAPYLKYASMFNVQKHKAQ